MARPVQYIQLSDSELGSLTTILSGGETRAQTQTRARILDLLHRRTHPDEISRLLRVGIATVFNVKSRYFQDGLERALFDLPRSGKPARITPENKAAITALACSDAPAGRARWTLRLLADKCVELRLVEAISHNEVGAILKKTNFVPTASSNGASGR